MRGRILGDLIAGGDFEQRLHLTLARSAAGARARRVAERLQRAAAALHDREDLALRDAIAVAHLRVVGQRFHHRVDGRGAAGTARTGDAAEQQLRAIVGQQAFTIEGLQQAGNHRGIAEHDRAAQPPVADDQLLVDAARRLRILHDLVIGIVGVLLAHRGELDAHHLQLGGHARAFVGRVRIRAGEPIGQHARLLPQRRDQPVDHAAMLRAFADRVDALVIRRREIVANDDAALDA